MIQFDYIKCPLHRYTFKVKPIRNWVELHSSGKVLNLFSGPTKLNLNEIRNDKDEDMPADYHLDAYDLVTLPMKWCFNTVILDPPYSYRKSMELYNNKKASRFKMVKDGLVSLVPRGGKVITFGYQSVSMGKGRGFEVERICLFSHGGAIHDTIATVEVKI